MTSVPIGRRVLWEKGIQFLVWVAITVLEILRDTESMRQFRVRMEPGYSIFM
jgi:hypothetical protein